MLASTARFWLEHSTQSEAQERTNSPDESPRSGVSFAAADRDSSRVPKRRLRRAYPCRSHTWVRLEAQRAAPHCPIAMLSTEPRAATILLVEDDLVLAAAVMDLLQADGYVVWHAVNGADAKAAVKQARPDLILLDLLLPDVDGLILCADIKAVANSPIIICSATPQRRDLVLGLKLGADDFITKPFDAAELEARVASVLRRVGAPEPAPPVAPPDELRVGALTIDRRRRRVTLGGQPIQLTPTEFRLLSTLASSPDEVLSREELALAVWGYEDPSAARVIDTHVSRLRAKLTAGPSPAPAIVAVRGFGFKISSARGTSASSAA